MTARVRTSLLVGLGLLLVQLGWMLVIVPDNGIDEFDHAFRASSVATGHWGTTKDELPRNLARGDLAPVRADVAGLAKVACAAHHYTRKYDCQPLRTLKNGNVLISGGAARYNPTYYVVVGYAAAPFHGLANLYAMRGVTALMAAILFMLTVWLALAGASTIWVLVALLVAAMPTTVYSASIVSPNGVELFAGLGAWVAVLALVAPRGEQRRSSAYGLLVLFAALLANTHTLGLLWLALIGVAVGLLHGPIVTIRALLPRNARERLLAAALVIAGGFEVFWLLTSGVNNPSSERTSIGGSPLPSILQGVLVWPLQAIAAFPSRNDGAPSAVYALMLVVLLGLLGCGLRFATLRSRSALTLAFIAATSLALPAYLTVRTFEELGAAWQGRYSMPFTVGIVVILGYLLDARVKDSPRSSMIGRSVVACLLLAELIGQIHVVATQKETYRVASAAHWAAPGTVLLTVLALLALGCWVRAVGSATRATVAAPVEARESVSA